MTHPERTPPAPVEINDDTLRGFVGYHIKRAFNVIQDDLTATLKPFGLRMLTHTALILIVDNPGLSQSQLAAAMDIERSNLVVIIDELEGRELIIRDRVPNDRRAYALKATLTGRRLCEKAVAACTDHEARIFAGLDTSTRDTLLKVLSSVRNSQNS
ncbi:MarR family winged helix-turn-helix transcriptional regulator [Falsiphaeobacter marinintestinus]|uniref:MarR family winged helix-turn-helix transcriptional regulator n=1 Tax=Falsiphaeobacter marinintestinus TaxID=1492905 RepID=UPI0011B5EE5D|nr:MarR family transcriptional regulator [Phaeobacter marinintestinus]